MTPETGFYLASAAFIFGLAGLLWLYLKKGKKS